MGTLELGLMRLRDSFGLWQSQANDACSLAASSLPRYAEKFVLTGGMPLLCLCAVLRLPITPMDATPTTGGKPSPGNALTI